MCTFNRQISSLTASKELPTTIEEGLLLWINKVSNVSIWNDRGHSIDKRVRLLKDRKVIPKVTHYSALTDGRAIAATLLYYHTSDTVSWKGTNNII